MVKQRIVEIEECQLKRIFQGLGSPFRSLTQSSAVAIAIGLQRGLGAFLSLGNEPLDYRRHRDNPILIYNFHGNTDLSSTFCLKIRCELSHLALIRRCPRKDPPVSRLPEFRF